jgi:hypothetical protein
MVRRVVPDGANMAQDLAPSQGFLECAVSRLGKSPPLIRIHLGFAAR